MQTECSEDEQKWFVGYLWGIETFFSLKSTQGGVRFVGYLWGIETHHSFVKGDPALAFVGYLWGIETWSIEAVGWVKWAWVCRLPMRNWNNPFLLAPIPWKTVFVGYLWGIETCFRLHFVSPSWMVCRLPMRNWNSLKATNHLLILTFVGYLWGIETGDHTF